MQSLFYKYSRQFILFQKINLLRINSLHSEVFKLSKKKNKAKVLISSNNSELL